MGGTWQRHRWKGDEDPVAKKHVKELGVALEEIGVVRGHSVPRWDGNDLKASPPKQAVTMVPQEATASAMVVKWGQAMTRRQTSGDMVTTEC